MHGLQMPGLGSWPTRPTRLPGSIQHIVACICQALKSCVRQLTGRTITDVLGQLLQGQASQGHQDREQQQHCRGLCNCAQHHSVQAQA